MLHNCQGRSLWYNEVMTGLTDNNKHEDEDREGRPDRDGREECSEDWGREDGKDAARLLLVGAVAALAMVVLSELSGSLMPVGVLLLLLFVRSLTG